MGLWAFVDVEPKGHRVASGNSFVSGRWRVEQATHRKFNFLIFQRGTDIGLADGPNSRVVDAGNNRLFPNNENHDFRVRPVGAIFHLRAYVVEEPSISEGPDIAPNRFDAVGIAGVQGNQGAQRICPQATIADEVEALDHVLGLGGLWRLRSGERLGH